MNNKVKFLSSLIIMAFFAIVPTSAQGVYFGVKGGLNNTNLKTDLDEISTKEGYGWFLGPTLKVDILPFLGVQGSVFYEQNNCKIEGKSIHQKSVLVPLDARLNLHIAPEAGIYLSTGPQFGFNVGDDEFDWDSSTSYKSTFQLKKSMFYWNFGIGAMITKRLELGYDVSFGIAKTGELKDLDEKDKPTSRTWHINATIYL